MLYLDMIGTWINSQMFSDIQDPETNVEHVCISMEELMT